MKNLGFTLIELLVVIALIGVLSSVLFTVVNPAEQLKKTRDAQRKQDLSQIQKALEVYYLDKGTYPESIETMASQYMAKVPQDPQGLSYVYQTEAGGYRLYAKLERCSDNQIIANINCPNASYNYSVVSPNLTVRAYIEPGAPTATSTPVSPTATATPAVARCANGVDGLRYSTSMVGCSTIGSRVTFSQAGNLCANGSHFCSFQEFLENDGERTGSNATMWLNTYSNFDSVNFCADGKTSYVISSLPTAYAFVTDYREQSYSAACGQNLGYYRGNYSVTSSTADGAVCCISN
ncbi:MAG: type II secretion system protein GspG [Candidatus Levybacteria bacterium]|nr:type II secretion system protein GspG [Candidatus Levybacteria bacterium]